MVRQWEQEHQSGPDCGSSQVRLVGMLRLTGSVFSLSTALADLVKNVDHEHLALSLAITGDESGFSQPVLQSLDHGRTGSADQRPEACQGQAREPAYCARYTQHASLHR
jgi:hypothetical protein